MEKITLKALQLAGFQNADTIAKIISYVPNPRVAAEMLLGVHTPEIVDEETRFRNYRYSRPNEFAELVEIDELADTVKYRIFKQKTQRVWYLTKEDRDNNIYVTKRPDKNYDYGEIPANGYDVTNHNTDRKSFEENWCNPRSIGEAYETINHWIGYGTEETLVEIELPF